MLDYVCMSVCMYVCIYVCIYLFIYLFLLFGSFLKGCVCRHMCLLRCCCCCCYDIYSISTKLHNL